jgi:hypothetical protein
MTVMQRRRTQSPWPGPVPYNEDQAAVFFGRAEETEALLDQMALCRLSVLTAWSGAGKSSLLNAALVPSLRGLRRDGHAVGTVLILNSWGRLIGESPAWMLAAAIRDEIRRVFDNPPKGVDDSVTADFQALHEVTLSLDDFYGLSTLEHWSRLRSYVSALCDAVGGLVLIIDQAEELLGSGLETPDPELEREVLSVIGRLHREEDRLNILISLREEYYARLRALDPYVEALASRTYRLSSMRRQTAEDAIIEAARNSENIALEDVAAKTIVSWVTDSKVAEPPAGGSAGRRGDGSRRAFDLLGLQALLVAVTDWAEDERHVDDGSALTIDALKLEGFQKELRETWTGTDDASLSKISLLKYIERLFEDEGDTLSIMRRLLVRMAPFLSGPGGFKRHIEETELVFNVVWPDLQRLGADDANEIRTELAKYRDSACRINFAAAEETAEDRLSGTARKDGLAPDAAAARLVDAGFGLIEYLKEKRVLKGGFARNRHTCELAHDGMGAALTEWAEKEKGQFRDVCSSVVSSGGEDFRWPQIGGDVSEMCWLACRLAGVVLKDVVFTHCTLKGTLFENCTFSNCTFVDCDMDGVLFAGGKVLATQGGGDAGLVLRNCDANSAVFRGVQLIGTVTFERSQLQFAQLFHFKTIGGKAVFDRCDLRNALLEDLDESEWVLLHPPQDSRRRTGLISNLPLIERSADKGERL